MCFSVKLLVSVPNSLSSRRFLICDESPSAVGVGVGGSSRAVRVGSSGGGGGDGGAAAAGCAGGSFTTRFFDALAVLEARAAPRSVIRAAFRGGRSETWDESDRRSKTGRLSLIMMPSDLSTFEIRLTCRPILLGNLRLDGRVVESVGGVEDLVHKRWNT